MKPVNLTVVDYSFARYTGAGLKAAGIDVVIRYLPIGSRKDLTVAEVTDLTSHGISVATVYETTTGRAREGFAAGTTDARKANAAADKIGQSKDRPIYYAVDEGAPWSAVSAYFDGVASIPGRAWGVYGPYDVIEGARSTKSKWLWQCAGFSGRGGGTGGSVMDITQEVRSDGKGRRLSSAAILYQCFGGAPLASTDLNLAFVADIGQWPKAGATINDTSLEDEDMKSALTVDSQGYVWVLELNKPQNGRYHVPSPEHLKEILGLDMFLGNTTLVNQQLNKLSDTYQAMFKEVGPGVGNTSVTMTPEDVAEISRQVAELAKLSPEDFKALIEAFGTALSNG